MPSLPMKPMQRSSSTVTRFVDARPTLRVSFMDRLSYNRRRPGWLGPSLSPEVDSAGAVGAGRDDPGCASRGTSREAATRKSLRCNTAPRLASGDEADGPALAEQPRDPRVPL